jgi:uncharacterized protein YjiS (DUF1127 family)
MSTTQYSMSYTALEKAAARPMISGLFNPLLSTAGRAYAFYRTRRALMELDDHMLSDIGLHRSQIENVARSLSRG